MEYNTEEKVVVFFGYTSDGKEGSKDGNDTCPKVNPVSPDNTTDYRF